MRDTASLTPGGIELTDYRERPDLAPALVELTAEAYGDIPGELAREDPPTLETWHRWQEAPSRRPEFVVVALDGGDVAGYAQLNSIRASATTRSRPSRAPSPARGGARAQGRAHPPRLRARARAAHHQLERQQPPMRTLNAALGYRPAAPRIYLRKQL